MAETDNRRERRAHPPFRRIKKLQDSLASLGAGFGSALLTSFRTKSLHILAGRISDGGLTPATDRNLLLTAYRGGSHLTSDINGASPPTAQQLETELERALHRRRYSTVLRSTVFTLVVVAAVSVLTATLFLPVLQIYGSSMEPTVSAGNIVVSVKGSDLEPGDVISFYYQNSVLVKRVIAVSGDWVDITEDGDVYVNGELLDEPYLVEKAYGEVTVTLPYQVPEGRVFVMGDHRSTSVDSRTTEVGCVAEENIIGRIVLRIWPLGQIGFVS